MASFDQSIQDVLGLLPPIGSEMSYVEYEQAVNKSAIPNGREALHWIVRKNLINKRITPDKTADPNTGKSIFVVMVGRKT